MPRKSAHERLEDLITAAVDLFIQKGYRRTQMADVTRAMGVSPGAIYRYVESKEALFDLVVRAGVSADIQLADLQLPIPTPPPGRTLAFLQEVLQHHGRMTALETALRVPTVDDPRVELEGIIRELYTTMARHRHGIKLIERSALDWPELADLWFNGARQGLIDRLQRYLTLRSGQDGLRAGPDTLAAARLMIETCAFFALHRHYDPAPTLLDDNVAEEAVVDALVHAYARR
jgi:AcrR family transcriptional regulator